MGQAWTCTSDPCLVKKEKALLQFTGLDYEAFKCVNVVIDEKKNFMRTIFVGNPEKPKLVLVHGFGGSGMIFYKIFKPLIEHFNVIAVDIMGMGACSRPSVELNCVQDSQNYFVEHMEKWRQTIGLEKFILAGHSFGGYVSGLYAVQHPQYVERLMLLSPAGVGDYPDYNFDEYIKQRREAGARVPSDRFIKLIKRAWRDKVSPFGILRKLGWFGSHKLVKRAVGRRMPGIPDEEKKALGEYLPQVMMKPGSTEYTLFVLFQPFMKALHGLENDSLLPQLEIPVAFVYGDEDWMRMDMEGAVRAKEKRDAKGLKTEIYELPQCGHHLYMENPEQLVEKIKFELRSISGEQIEAIEGRVTNEVTLDGAQDYDQKYMEDFAAEQEDPDSPDKEPANES